MFPLPEFYTPETVETVYRVDYADRSIRALDYRLKNGLQPASFDHRKIWLMLIDVQNTFCIPGFELYVGGRSGSGAVDDNRRLCEFIYHNLGSITHISATMDTHNTMQIFHPLFFVDAAGGHPVPYTDLHLDDLKSGKWKFNPELVSQFGLTPEYGQQMMIPCWAGSVMPWFRRSKKRFSFIPWRGSTSLISKSRVSVLSPSIIQ
jgi:hypothetical protein